VQISIVTTLYKSAPHIKEFSRRINAAVQAVTEDYEIVFVDDGSPDNSLTLAKEALVADNRVKIVELSRNFGHHKAIMTGLAYAQGDLVFLIDADLEEEPELLPRFYDELNHSGADVVYGQQNQRKGNVIERHTGRLFYWLFNRLSAHKIPADLLTVRLMRRNYVDALLEHREREVCLAGLWAITGFHQIPLPVIKHAQAKTTYTLAKRVELAVRAITSFSDKPLIYVAQVGVAVLTCSFIALCWIVGRKLFSSESIPGYTSLIVSIWFMGGMTTFSVGLVGIYLARVFKEVKQRPYTLVKTVHTSNSMPTTHRHNQLQKAQD